MSTYDEDDAIGPDNGEEAYEVGYGKPPKHGQFGKGNKAGKGRPKGAQNMKSLVNKAGSEKVAVKKNGKVMKVAKAELAINQVFSKAAAGDPKFTAKAIELHERYGPQEEAPASAPAKDDPDIATLRNYLDWHDELYGEDDCE